MRKRVLNNIPRLIIFALSIFWIMPLFLILINSFKPYNEMMQHFLSLPSSISFKMYLETWKVFDFPILVLNTFIYTILTLLGVVLFAPMAAYKLSRTKSKLSSVFFILIIMPMMVPFQAYMISLTKFTSIFKLNGTQLGYVLVNIGLCMPLAVFMIHGFVKGIPKELEESANIDGASKMTVYFRIILPLLKPILATVVVLDAIATWNDVIVNQLIIGGSKSYMNIQNALYMQFSAQTSDWEHALPGIIMAAIPSLIFFLLMQKNIIGSVTAGSVKG
ncbi:carbohydrate ABC transporter permease [Vallitalea maricola]|uniref:Carbohydrate ABC transporter permease n=1 Tax=Vallitalea maricola TaxID=3074433 RepID=A0ACB5UGE5_9FIRM|nr:carbohydrate ABC transporter permease [Vallitalea sp. AN17-2]